MQSNCRFLHFGNPLAFMVSILEVWLQQLCIGFTTLEFKSKLLQECNEITIPISIPQGKQITKNM